MGAISRRSFLAGSAAVTALAALPWQEPREAAARVPAPATGPSWAGEDAVEYALRQGCGPLG